MIPGCVSQGKTKAEALKNIKEAIALFLAPDDDRQLVALPIQYQFGGLVHIKLSLTVQSGKNNAGPMSRQPLFALLPEFFSARPNSIDGRPVPDERMRAQTRHMNKLNFILLKIVRWTGWPLLPLVLLFLLTGYIMDGRYGLSRVLDEKSALTIHRMMHLPLVVLVLAHSLPAAYLAMQRWGWISHREET